MSSWLFPWPAKRNAESGVPPTTNPGKPDLQVKFVTPLCNQPSLVNGDPLLLGQDHSKCFMRLTSYDRDEKELNGEEAMDIDDKPGGIHETANQNSLAESHANITDLSLHNHPESQSRGNKRVNDEYISNPTQANFYTKKNKREGSEDTDSQPSSDHEHYEDESHMDHNHDVADEVEPPSTSLLKDLETRAITVSQLIQEVKGIYAGLVMVEKKCIEIVTQQASNPTKLSKEQWQALIALHRTLLNEHHDFFSASHHPITAGHELRDLAARYAMPARMWRHGIHAFLELLRSRLPDSLEHMLSFVYLAYSMMALLKETVPDFLETWIECLGDLARYRMAIEEADLRDREIWSNTARMWYNEAADLSLNTGRIQHHLAVLARPNIVQQLFLYSKALVAAIPFKNAGESIMLLFNPLDQAHASNSRYPSAEFNLVSAAATTFRRKSIKEYNGFRGEFILNLEAHMARTGSRFKTQGPEIAGSIFAMILDFGKADNTLWAMLSKHQHAMRKIYCENYGVEDEKLPKDFVVQDPVIIDRAKQEYWSDASLEGHKFPSPDLSLDRIFESSDEVTVYVGLLLHQTISTVASHIGNKNVIPFMHMVLAHLHALTWIPGASVYIEKFIPWDKIELFLNTVGRSGINYDNVETTDFPKVFGGNKRQLPEDFPMRGLMILSYYYKPGFFSRDDLVDEDERLLEQPSHQAPRVERCLYAAVQLAHLNDRWLSYDDKTKMFKATAFSQTLNRPAP